VVTPVSFYFLAPGSDLSTTFTATANGLPDVQAQFSFDTQNGVIVAWHIMATGGASHNTDTVTVDSSAGDTYEDDWFACGPSPCTYQANTAITGIWSYGADLVIALQKQMTHITSEMTVYRTATVFYEAEYLAAYGMMCKAQMTKC